VPTRTPGLRQASAVLNFGENVELAFGSNSNVF
jgi:hypothetical protein